jgi:methylmalonyl-CoA mutase
MQIQTVTNLQKGFEAKAQDELAELQKIAITQGNLFEKLMESVKYCSLGQITSTLFNVGGQYRRNM